MKKKLIFITEALWIGGIETALVNLLNRLDYDRYNVTCLILRDCQEMAYRITPKCRLIVSDRQHAVTFREGYHYKRNVQPYGGATACLKAPSPDLAHPALSTTRTGSKAVRLPM